MSNSKLFSNDGALSRFSEVALGIIFIGLLMLAFCIPIVTIGPAFTAGYYAMAKCVRHKEGYIFKSFMHAMKVNLKTAMISWIFFLLAGGALVYDFIFVNGTEGSLGSAMYSVFIAIAVMYLLVFFFFFFELSRFDRKGFQLFRFAVITAFKHLPSSFLILAMFAAAGACIYFIPWTAAVAPAIALYGATFIMERVMRKYMPEPEEGSPEADKWYYRS